MGIQFLFGIMAENPDWFVGMTDCTALKAYSEMTYLHFNFESYASIKLKNCKMGSPEKF